LDWSEKAAVNATDQCSHRIDNAHRIRARSRAKRGSDSASGRTGHCANRHRANRSATAAAAKTGIADAISDNPVALISAFRQQHGEGRSPSAPALTRIAQEQANAMATRDSLDHDVLAPF
jgi:hypothetical protein